MRNKVIKVVFIWLHFHGVLRSCICRFRPYTKEMKPRFSLWDLLNIRCIFLILKQNEFSKYFVKVFITKDAVSLPFLNKPQKSSMRTFIITFAHCKAESFIYILLSTSTQDIISLSPVVNLHR